MVIVSPSYTLTTLPMHTLGTKGMVSDRVISSKIVVDCCFLAKKQQYLLILVSAIM